MAQMAKIQHDTHCMAYRDSDGIEVALLWYPNNPENEFEVWVKDSKNGNDFNLYPETGKQALHAFYHPFSSARGIIAAGRIAA